MKVLRGGKIGLGGSLDPRVLAHAFCATLFCVIAGARRPVCAFTGGPSAF